MVPGVELTVLRGVAGQTLPVVVAGQTVVGTGLAGGSGLPERGQLLETLLNAGAASAEVVAVSADRAPGGRKTLLALRRAGKSNGGAIVVETH